VLIRILREMLQSKDDAPAPEPARFRVLNVGGRSKEIPLPSHYDGWEHLLLDIDPRGNPDVVCDARNLESLGALQFDAVYCSHNLEHYYRHDCAAVLRGFRHVLKADGFAEIIVPDLQSVIAHVVEMKLDLGDLLYESGLGPITALDVIYGLATEIESTGQEFFAHKNGFTRTLLERALKRVPFEAVLISARSEAFEVRALGFRSPPSPRHRQLLGLA
jgi:SAM-dependent methyltransferase